MNCPGGCVQAKHSQLPILNGECGEVGEVGESGWRETWRMESKVRVSTVL